MKKLLKFIGLLLVVVVITVAVMAVSNFCPPRGPWPAPPWCPGSTIPWPFSDPNAQSALNDDSSSSTSDDDPAPSDEVGQSDVADDLAFDESVSENERLAQVAIGLVQDLSSVNSYFNDAASAVSG